jgi:hypothetical protein
MQMQRRSHKAPVVAVVAVVGVEESEARVAGLSCPHHALKRGAVFLRAGRQAGSRPGSRRAKLYGSVPA